MLSYLMATNGAKQFELSITLGDASFSASGDKASVLKAYEDFKEIANLAPASGSGGGRGGSGGSGGESKKETKVSKPAAAKSGPLGPLLKRDNLNTNDKRATAVVAWAEDNQSKKSLTSGEIEELWKKKAASKAPGNLPRDIQKAVNAGYLDRDGHDLSVTGFGRSELKL